MGTIYGICLVVGGILLLLTLFLGHDTATEADVHAELDTGIHDADHHIDLKGDFKGDVANSAHLGLLFPIFSLRFWIFGSAFFGLTGVLLTLLQSFTGLESSLIIAIISTIMGFSIGSLAIYLFRYLQRNEANSMISLRHCIGRSAHVLIPLDPQSKGKIRVEIDSHTIDFIAETDESNPLQKGDPVTIIDIDPHGVAKVIKPIV